LVAIDQVCHAKQKFETRERSMAKITSSEMGFSIIAAMMRWVRDGNSLRHLSTAAGNTKDLTEAGRAAQSADGGGTGNEMPSLLMRRMMGLDLDPNDLGREEPALVREFQVRCSACVDQERCASALLNDLADPAWQEWRDYCPNSTALVMLSTIRGCS
jgi:hypothetical protein